jgi:Spy/CpxP family protein refolding chaperone
MGSPGEGWWKDPQLRQKLQLSDGQIQKIEKIAHDQHIQDIDLRAAVEKQDALLRTLLESDALDTPQALAQVDKLSEARARLEKSHVEMLLAIRKVLTAEQAKKLRDLPPMDGPQGPGFGPPNGRPGGPPEGGPGEPPNGPPEPPPNGNAN